MIFNGLAAIQVLAAAMPAALTYAILHYALGWPTATWWAVILGCLFVVPVDLIARSTAIRASEDDDSPAMGMSAFVKPSGGGHLMFLPMYGVGALASLALYLGWISA